MAKDEKNKKTGGKTNAKKSTLLLLDTHAILHRAYHALPDFTSTTGEPTGALYGLMTMLFKAIADIKPDYIVACYDLPQKTHRHEQFEDYKAGRAKADDELVAQIIRSKELLDALSIPRFELPGFEADDLLGSISQIVKSENDSKKEKENEKEEKNICVVIASGDMDTLQLVDGERVKVYTLKKGIKDTVIYDEDGVRDRFGFAPTMLPDYKGLRGDPSDNIPGIRGIGEKTAETLLTQIGDLQKIYDELENGNDQKFLDAGVKARIISLLREGKEEAFFSRMLGEVRRDAPVNFSLEELFPNDSTWKERMDFPKAEAFLKVLGFRSLLPKLNGVLGIKSETGNLFNEWAAADVSASENISEDENNLNRKEEEKIDEQKLKEAKVMTWLLNSNASNPDIEDVKTRAEIIAGKSVTFEEAHQLLSEKIKKEELTRVYEEIEEPLISVVDEMNARGICIDIPYLKKLSEKYHKDLDELQKKIYKEAGEEFNIGSPKQLREVLFDKLELAKKGIKKTGTGVRSTAEGELEKLKDVHPIIPSILGYRELAKLLSTYIDSFPKLVDEHDQLRTTFVQTGTTTGRISSQSPNLQNIPIRGELGAPIRNAFIARKGMKLLSIDYSQIELRIAAWLSGDEKLRETFVEGRDIHSRVASEVFNVSEDAVTRDQRSVAKTLNFGILYGMGVNAVRQNLGSGTTRDDASFFLNRYFESFPRLSNYLEETKRFAKKHGYTLTYFGRKRYFEGIHSKIPFLRASAERMAVNAPIQGTQADIIKKAMVRGDEYLKSRFAKDDKNENEITSGGLILQIHDELVYELPEDCIHEVALEIKKIMEEVVSPEETEGILFKAEGKIGNSWGDMEKI